MIVGKISFSIMGMKYDIWNKAWLEGHPLSAAEEVQGQPGIQETQSRERENNET